MASIDDFSEFTIERYQALYDRIRAKQVKLVSEFSTLSRDNDKGFEVAKVFYMNTIPTDKLFVKVTILKDKKIVLGDIITTKDK